MNPQIHPSINPSAAQVRLFASAKSWIKGEALRQLYAASNLDGALLAVGFPDLHPGKASPVGAALVTEGFIYKNIEDVVQDLVDAGLVSVIATFRPLLTYKTRALRR